MKLDDKKKTSPPLYLRDEDISRCKKAWLDFLDNIRALAEARILEKRKVFISYAWPPTGVERDQLQHWLKQLQDYLEKAGIKTFYDLRDMKGHLDTTMKKNLEESNFVMPILTPKFLERAQDSKTNLAFEFGLTQEKVKQSPEAILPILHSGLFGDVVKDPLAPLMKHLIYGNTSLEPLLSSLSDPLGLIPVIYNIRTGDKEYEKILQQWRDSHLTRIPDILPDTMYPVERTELLKKLKQGFERKQDEKRSPIQVIQGIGGAGKSELAIWYAHHGYQNGGFIRWIYADTTNLETEWLYLGELLGLDLKGVSQAEQRRQIRQALKERPSWLIILDNVEKQAHINGLLPKNLSPSQQVLITTRSKICNAGSVIALEEFTAEEAELYCEKSLGPEQSSGAKELAKQLDYLPLALFYAVSYMKKTCINARAFLERYQQEGVKLLGKEMKHLSSSETRYQYSVLTTWHASVLALESHHPKAAELITLSPYLHHNYITESFLKKLHGINTQDFDDCIAAILEYGLIVRQGDGFKIQRLILESIAFREKETSSKVDFFAKRIRPLALKIYMLYPRKLNNSEDYATARQLMPHIETLYAHLSRLVSHTDRDENSPLAWQARLYTLRGQFYEDAKKYLALGVTPSVLLAPQTSSVEVKQALLPNNQNRQSFFAGRKYKSILIILILTVAGCIAYGIPIPFLIPIINSIKGLGIIKRENNSLLDHPIGIEETEEKENEIKLPAQSFETHTVMNEEAQMNLQDQVVTHKLEDKVSDLPSQPEKQSIQIDITQEKISEIITLVQPFETHRAIADEEPSRQQNLSDYDEKNVTSNTSPDVISEPTSQNQYRVIPPPPPPTTPSEAQMDLQAQLVAACKQGDTKEVKSLLEKGAQPDLASRSREQPLGAAVWGMRPEVVQMIKNAADQGKIALKTWKECEEHNFIHYRETFIVTKFEPETFLEWFKLLEKIDKSFLQEYHLKKVDESHHDNDSSSWQNWKKFIKRAGTRSFRGCASLWGDGVNNAKCTAETELGYANFREQIKQLIEPVLVATPGMSSS